MQGTGTRRVSFQSHYEPRDRDRHGGSVLAIRDRDSVRAIRDRSPAPPSRISAEADFSYRGRASSSAPAPAAPSTADRR